MKCYNSIVIYFKFCTLRRLLSCEVKCFLHPVESISAPNIRFFLLHFFTRNPLRKTAKSKHFNTQLLSQHCPTDRHHTRFSLSIVRFSSVNGNLWRHRLDLNQHGISPYSQFSKLFPCLLGLLRHITRDFRPNLLIYACLLRAASDWLMSVL